MTPMELAQMAMRSGLKVATCDDLLRRGWSYVEQNGHAPVWVGPMAKMKEPRKTKRESA